MKTHKYLQGCDFREHGQTNYEYTNSTLCGYVREKVTKKDSEVTCKLCLKEIENKEDLWVL